METKLCPGCKETKSVDLFSRNKHRLDGLQRTCKQCIREAGIRSYNKNKQAYQSRSAAYNKSILDSVNQYKADHPCKKCGNSKYYLLDFHHIDPSIKDGDVNTIARTRSRKALWDEIAKCIVLCKNCHADFHYQEKEYGTNLETYLS